MRAIFAIFKKELTRFLTDRRMLFALIAPGVLIYIIYSLMGSFMTEGIVGSAPTEDTTYIVYVQNQPSEEIYAFDKMDVLKIQTVKVANGKEEEIEEKVREGSAHLYVSYEKDFHQKMLAYTVGSDQEAPVVTISYNSMSEESQMVYAYYSACLENLERSICNKFDVITGDTANESDITTYILKMVLPMLLITLIYSGCMTVTTESIAGEKERGTIATLLVTPVKRSHLVLGKVFALSVLALISGTSSFIGVVASLPTLFGSELGIDTELGFGAMPYGLMDYAAILAVVSITVLLFTVFIMILSTFAKSVKEATGFAGPLVLVMMVLSLATSIFPVNGLIGYCVPLFNIVLCLSSVVALEFNAIGFLITLLTDAALFAIGVFVMIKMFDNEKVMFGK